MKKALLTVVAFAFVFSMATSLYAADLPRPVNKIVKGAVAIVKSPMVAYDHAKKEADAADNKLFGFLKGVMVSPFHLINEIGHGALDIVTFPIE